jgi:hypothetical protein
VCGVGVVEQDQGIVIILGNYETFTHSRRKAQFYEDRADL